MNRQPYMQHRSPERMARHSFQRGMAASHGRIGGGAMGTAAFAQSIAGKYGYRIGDPFGRLPLVFLQQLRMAPVKSVRASRPAWLVQLQLQQQALRHSDAPQLPYLRQTLLQLVQIWMRRGMAEGAGRGREPSRLGAPDQVHAADAANGREIASGDSAVRWRLGSKTDLNAAAEQMHRVNNMKSYLKYGYKVQRLSDRQFNYGKPVTADNDPELRMLRIFDNKALTITTKINAAAANWAHVPADSRSPGANMPYRSSGSPVVAVRDERQTAVFANRRQGVSPQKSPAALAAAPFVVQRRGAAVSPSPDREAPWHWTPPSATVAAAAAERARLRRLAPLLRNDSKKEQASGIASESGRAVIARFRSQSADRKRSRNLNANVTNGLRFVPGRDEATSDDRSVSTLR